MPSFSVDAGFRYAVPAGLAPVETGSMVRIPLGGRRVRGFVVGVDEGDVDGLKPIAALSGDRPVFDAALLDTLRWAAQHYVAPLSVMLERAAPPNNPRGSASRPVRVDIAGDDWGEVVAASRNGRRVPPFVVLAGRTPDSAIAATTARILADGRSSMVVTATAREAEDLFETVSSVVPGQAVVAHGDMPDRAVTGAWARAGVPCVLIGTPRVACWPVARLGAAIVVEEGRRAMKDRQTPTLAVRDVLRRRAQAERFPLVVVGPTPTTEVLATGPTVLRQHPGRLWGLVEVVDRRQESTAGAVLTDPVRRAVAAVTRRGGSTFVFGHRRGYAAATRCVACREVRTCESCGSRPDPGEVCSRCGAALGPCRECGGSRFEALGAGVGRVVAEVGRIVGTENVGAAPSSAAVVVGTERDLIGLEGLDLVVLPDLDGLVLGTNYRAAEDALRLCARLAGTLGHRGGRRMMVQTSDPDHPVVRSLVKGDPMAALGDELASRAALGYPPAGELAVIEVSGDAPGIDTLAQWCDVLGPAPHGDGRRWLLTASDLGRAKQALRPLVQRWRDGGARVRIDVDPIDL